VYTHPVLLLLNPYKKEIQTPDVPDLLHKSPLHTLHKKSPQLI
jgi:hypothetical protein